MYPTSDFKDIGIRKSEFVARTHFFCLDSFWGEGTVFYPLWWHVTRDNASIFHEFFKYVSFRSVYKRNSLFLAENPCSKLGRIKIINVLYLQRLPTKNERLEVEPFWIMKFFCATPTRFCPPPPLLKPLILTKYLILFYLYKRTVYLLKY